ncbi:hypothetical protein IAQ61_010619 [Plenodomus lingam]|uniref:uncharacterized protein n=1 Tax=Leptosphaeria maculans TaxID=5022 RepID=UPI00331BD986|nr:hypothetical protein IAQ61_010619 [Plenodomus lingam]
MGKIAIRTHPLPTSTLVAQCHQWAVDLATSSIDHYTRLPEYMGSLTKYRSDTLPTACAGLFDVFSEKENTTQRASVNGSAMEKAQRTRG